MNDAAKQPEAAEGEYQLQVTKKSEAEAVNEAIITSRADEEELRELEEAMKVIEQKKKKVVEKMKKTVRVVPLEDNLAIFACKCGKSHFRHAGYMKTIIPFARSSGEAESVTEDRQVHICVSCKTAYLYAEGKMYDVTEKIDLQAWDRTEREAHHATGPGGQC